ncbi:hypothetical protein DY000_02058778 [Brassica cretica]|uniref:Uncharacterized protein n=1 Tax=Brassica cretica TaxID=69181 RepID=A0ABQ7B1F6_BRACR|nr:hypothetical protein DY000_02058778 [Brassica cretica]
MPFTKHPVEKATTEGTAGPVHPRRFSERLDRHGRPFGERISLTARPVAPLKNKITPKTVSNFEGGKERSREPYQHYRDSRSGGALTPSNKKRRVEEKGSPRTRIIKLSPCSHPTNGFGGTSCCSVNDW